MYATVVSLLTSVSRVKARISSDMSGTLTKMEFEPALQAAVSKRASNYTNFYAFHIRWEDDDTYADRDGKSFEEITKLLSFPRPQVSMLSRRQTLRRVLIWTSEFTQ